MVAVHASGTLRTSPEVSFSVAKPLEKSGAAPARGASPPASSPAAATSASAMLSFLMMVQKPPALRMSWPPLPARVEAPGGRRGGG